MRRILLFVTALALVFAPAASAQVLTGQPVNSFYLDLIHVCTGNVGVGTAGTPSQLCDGAGHLLPWYLGDATLNAATGDEYAAKLQYTVNKAAGDDHGLYINMIDEGSPGTSYPLWVGVGGVAKAYVGAGDADVGLYGKSITNAGLFGSSTSGYGIYGSSGTSAGLFGTSANSYAGYFSRNTETPAGNVPVALILQDHALNDDAALEIRQDGTGSMINFNAGGTSRSGLSLYYDGSNYYTAVTDGDGGAVGDITGRLAVGPGTAAAPTLAISDGTLVTKGFYSIDASNIGLNASIQASNFKTDSTTFTTFAGGLAGLSNTGTYSNGFGRNALYLNTGVNSNGFGDSALRQNTGAYSNGFGHNALYLNTGASSNGLGFYALYLNTGANSNGLGFYALLQNTGAYSNGFGHNALQYNDGANNTAIGSSAFSAWTDGVSETVDSVDPATERVTITGHGFGAIGTITNFKATTTGTLPTGLSTAIHQWKVIDANTLECVTDSFTDAGTGTHTLTQNTIYTNSTAVGYNAQPTASNQVVLGDVNVTQVKTAAAIVSAAGALAADAAVTEAADGRLSTYTWKGTIDFGDLSAAALTNDITVVTLPAKAILQYAILTIAVVPVGVTTFTQSLDNDGAAGQQVLVTTADQIGGAINTVFGDADAERGTDLPDADMMGAKLYSYTATQAITMRATSTVVNLDQLSAGQWNVTLVYSVLP